MWMQGMALKQERATVSHWEHQEGQDWDKVKPPVFGDSNPEE